MATQCYTGPAGAMFTDDDLLVIWAYLTRTPTEENQEVRNKIQRYLESRDNQRQ